MLQEQKYDKFKIQSDKHSYFTFANFLDIGTALPV